MYNGRLNIHAPRTLTAPQTACPTDGDRTPAVCSRAVDAKASTIIAPYAGKQAPKLDGENRASHKNESAKEARIIDVRLTYVYIRIYSHYRSECSPMRTKSTP